MTLPSTLVFPGLGLYSNSVLFAEGGPIDLPDLAARGESHAACNRPRRRMAASPPLAVVPLEYCGAAAPCPATAGPVSATQHFRHGLLGLAADVNNHRVVVAGNRLLDLDTMELTIVPLPRGNWQGVASADLNQNDDFCGYIAGFSGCSTFPIRCRQGIGWEFIGGCATTTSAVSMNDAGDTLTSVYQGGLGAVFIDEGYVNLTTLIDPAEGPWLACRRSTTQDRCSPRASCCPAARRRSSGSRRS